MAIDLNHTIVHSRDALASARFLSEILGLAEPVPMGPFQAVGTSNGVSERELPIWADPRMERPGEIGTDHGRGFYFQDPSGHYLEVLTKPYEPW